MPSRARSIRRAGTAALLLLAPAAVLPLAVHAAQASTKEIAASSSDIDHFLGSGFKRQAATTVTSKTVTLSAHSSRLQVLTYLQHGFQSGYVTTYVKNTGTTTFKNGKLSLKPGVTSVGSSVLAFKNAAGPQWEFQHASTKTTTKKVNSVTMRVRRTSDVGEEAILETSSADLKQLGTVNTMALTWRRGAYIGTLSASAYGKLPMSKLIDLAKRIDDRISH